jgi:fused signal recognition particle receptor
MTDQDYLELGREQATGSQEADRGFWSKLRRGLTMTHTELLGRIEAAVAGHKRLDEESLETLEESLIGADLGVEASLELVDRLARDVRAGEVVEAWRVRERLIDEIAILLLDAPRPPNWDRTPAVTLFVGVNGVGKTTSIAKLARRYQASGSSVLIAAADTFRAAATEQLEIWGRRLDIDVIGSGAGTDPGAVVFDAIQAAKARGSDHLLVDTAGRLHTKDNLMGELGKIHRILEREATGFNHRSLLVLDATTGHNAIQQARQFSEASPLDGVLLAKIDGTAKGGMAVAVARDLRLPVLYLGVGESADDLVDFRPREFAEALLGGGAAASG